MADPGEGPETKLRPRPEGPENVFGHRPTSLISGSGWLGLPLISGSGWPGPPLSQVEWPGPPLIWRSGFTTGQGPLLSCSSLESVEQNARHANGHTRDWRRETRGARKQRDSLFSSQAAAVVSRVARLRRSRARALLLLNLKKKRDYSQCIILRKRIIRQFQIFPLLSSMGVVGAPGNTTKYPAYSKDIRHALEVFCEIKDSALLLV